MQEYFNNIEILEVKIKLNIEEFDKILSNVSEIKTETLVNKFYDLDMLYNIAFFLKEVKHDYTKKATELTEIIKNYLQSIQYKIYQHMKTIKKNNKYTHFFKKLLNKMKVSGLLSDKEKYQKITKYHEILVKHLDTINDIDLLSFIKLFICRNKMAKITGFNNYISYASGISGNSDIELEHFMNIRKNVYNYSKILDNINIKDVKKLDVINLEKYLFKPEQVLLKIIEDMKNLFGLNFIINEEKFKWSENIVCLDVFTEENLFLGTIYLDIMQDENREEDKLSVVKIMNRYNDYDNPNVVVIFADYYSLDKECIDYNTIVQLYKSFVCAIEMISNINNICLLIDDDNQVRILLELFIELYVFSSNTISYFIKDKKVVSFIKQVFQDNFMYSQKKLCVDTLLDNIIYHEDEFVKIFTDNADNEEMLKKELNNAYYAIAEEFGYTDLTLDKTFIDKNLYNGGRLHIALYSSIYAKKLMNLYKKHGNVKSFCKKILVTDRYNISNKLSHFFNRD
jgi:hypothetical protein